LLRVLLANILEKTGGSLNVKATKEIASVIGEIRALVKDCTSTEIKMGQLIDIGKVTIIVQALANIVAKYIKDPETIEKIATEFDNVLWPAPLASTPQAAREAPSREVQKLPGEVC
jgi:hypothetical protein